MRRYRNRFGWNSALEQLYEQETRALPPDTQMLAARRGDLRHR